jgi:hypothetical protein
LRTPPNSVACPAYDCQRSLGNASARLTYAVASRPAISPGGLHGATRQGPRNLCAWRKPQPIRGRITAPERMTSRGNPPLPAARSPRPQRLRGRRRYPASRVDQRPRLVRCSWADLPADLRSEHYQPGFRWAGRRCSAQYVRLRREPLGRTGRARHSLDPVVHHDHGHRCHRRRVRRVAHPRRHSDHSRRERRHHCHDHTGRAHLHRQSHRIPTGAGCLNDPRLLQPACIADLFPRRADLARLWNESAGP